MQGLIDIYNKGWYDCPYNISHLEEYEDRLERRAYQLGWDHYIIGDDVKSVDALTDEEVLEMINAPIA